VLKKGLRLVSQLPKVKKAPPIHSINLRAFNLA
jgi:hypothetical protein